MSRRLVAASVLALSCGACSQKKSNEIWIYSSTYKEVIAKYAPLLKREVPDVEVQWYQSGSENVAAKILAETLGGETKADLLMTSDLFFCEELKSKGQLLPLNDIPAVAKLPKNVVDPDKTFIVSRYPVMVLAYNTSLPESERPKSFKDLADPKFKGKATMPSPMESGSTLTAVMYLRRLYGDDFFNRLRANEILASGGNGSALSRIQSKERPVGMVLMENVLQAKEKGQTSVDFVVPNEGALPIPSPLAILKSTKHPEIARKIFEWLLSAAAQEILTNGWVYSIDPSAAAPHGAPPWDKLKLQSWDFVTFSKWSTEKQGMKDLFQNTVLK